MSKQKTDVADFSRWMIQRADEQPGRFVFLTLIFDRARKYYSPAGGAAEGSPTRFELAAGLSLIMPRANAKQALIADLKRFYCLVLRALFGRRYAHRFALQPFGIGALDEPTHKGPDKRSAMSRKVGEVFDHAHFVLHIPDVEIRGQRLPDIFETLLRDGSLRRLWRKLNPEGEVHASAVFDLASALDYSLKMAKRQDVPSDEILIWPVGVPRRRVRSGSNDLGAFAGRPARGMGHG